MYWCHRHNQCTQHACVILCILAIVNLSLACPPTPCTGNAATGKKEVVFSGHRKGVEGVVGHKGHVMALAVSSDGKFLVSDTHHTTCVHTFVIPYSGKLWQGF